MQQCITQVKKINSQFSIFEVLCYIINRIEENSKYLLSIYLESYDEAMDFSLDIE